MPIIGRGGHARNESLGFRLRPRNQRRKCAGIADRAWREGQGAVGRPEPAAGDESAPDRARTHCRYRRVGRVARDCGEGRRPHHRCADTPRRSPEISGNCSPCSLADGGGRPCRPSCDPQPRHHRGKPCACRPSFRTAGLHAHAWRHHHCSRAERRAADCGKEFFAGIYETALTPQELLVAVELPVAPKNSTHFFHEFARRHGDYAIVGLAAQAFVKEGRFTDLRLGFFAVGDRPLLARAAGKLVDVAITSAVLSEAFPRTG